MATTKQVDDHLREQTYNVPTMSSSAPANVGRWGVVGTKDAVDDVARAELVAAVKEDHVCSSGSCPLSNWDGNV